MDRSLEHFTSRFQKDGSKNEENTRERAPCVFFRFLEQLVNEKGTYSEAKMIQAALFLITRVSKNEAQGTCQNNNKTRARGKGGLNFWKLCFSTQFLEVTVSKITEKTAKQSIKKHQKKKLKNMTKKWDFLYISRSLNHERNWLSSRFFEFCVFFWIFSKFVLNFKIHSSCSSRPNVHFSEIKKLSP